MRKIAVRMYGARFIVACASLGSVVFVACASDDASTTPPPKTDAGHESSTADVSAESSSNDGSTDSANDSANDTSTDSADAAVCTPLSLCDTFDKIWGIVPKGGEPSSCATETNGSCGARLTSWVGAIVTAFAGAPGIFTDCRINNLVSTSPGLLTMDQQNSYEGQLNNYALDFLGCPYVYGPDAGPDSGADAGPLPAFGVIPAPLAANVFTSADLSLLSMYWSQAIQAAVAMQTDGGTLTSEQLKAINAQLACQSMLQGPTPSETYNYSACTDGGLDGGVDGGGEGGADASDGDREGGAEASRD